ncbi:hypothetical protein LSM04_000540 [Trypanosoma melophagium]|uniref:uncharacterized protein n=1 Tax=Trypanosoma melophagium TaxID=715481 RepID=UPI00351A00C8|nr:hypothetical protein LSM04_000540 [Trypanosoma melophagium]
MDAQFPTLSEKERNGTAINVDIPTKMDNPCTVQTPVANSVCEGEVIDASVPAPPMTGPVFLTTRGIISSVAQRCANKSTVKSQACKIPLNFYLNSSESQRQHIRLAKQTDVPKQGRARSVSSSNMERSTGVPYKESRSKRLRDQVMGARDILSSSEQVLLLTRDNNECIRKLREKEEQLKKLEVMVQNFRVQMVRGASTVNNSIAKSDYSEMNSQVMRLVNENAILDKRLREANAQITELKRDARVAYLHELKTELAVYQAEVVRLSSMMRGRNDKVSQKNPLESRFRETLDSLQEKEKIIQDLRESIVESASALNRSLEDAMRAKSKVLQLQEANEALLKELKMLRKTTLMLKQTHSELECTRSALREANGRLREFEQILGVVDSPADVLAVIKERDALISLLREQHERYEREQQQFASLQGETKQKLRDSLNEVLQQERALAKDKEIQLRRVCMMWKKRYEQLALERAAERGSLREELRAITKYKEEERQEELCQLLSKIQQPTSEVHRHYESYPQERCESSSAKPQTTKVPTLTDTSSNTSFATSSSSSCKERKVSIDSWDKRKTGTKQNAQIETISGQEYPNFSATGEMIPLKLSESHHGSIEGKSSQAQTKPNVSLPPCDVDVAANEERTVSPLKTKESGSHSISEISLRASDDTQDTGKERLALASSAELMMGLLGTGPQRNDVSLSPTDSTPTPAATPVLATSAGETPTEGDAETGNSLPLRVQVPPPLQLGGNVGKETSELSKLSISRMSSFSNLSEHGDAQGPPLKSRYEEDESNTMDSPNDEDGSFTVHHVKT